jgi:tRNA pseudouridine55 synthase
MTCGVVLLDKDTGMSSAAAVARAKRILDVDRIGHAGTLDPMASGMLVCLTGPATRLASFPQHGAKLYSGTIVFGRTTSTDDITGETLEESGRFPRYSDVDAALSSFTGSIQQIPPRISAVKVQGERSYRRARRGEEFELQARTVEVERFEIRPIPENDENACVSVGFLVQCSKGTYIRSLARDLGEALGCGGCLGSLRREAVLPFHVADAHTLADLKPEHLLPWDVLFPATPSLHLSEAEARRVRNGERGILEDLSRRSDSALCRSPYVVYYGPESGRPLGLLSGSPEGKLDIAMNLDS